MYRGKPFLVERQIHMIPRQAVYVFLPEWLEHFVCVCLISSQVYLRMYRQFRKKPTSSGGKFNVTATPPISINSSTGSAGRVTNLVVVRCGSSVVLRVVIGGTVLGLGVVLPGGRTKRDGGRGGIGGGEGIIGVGSEGGVGVTGRRVVVGSRVGVVGLGLGAAVVM